MIFIQGDMLTQKDAGDIDGWLRIAYAEGFSVGKAGDAQGAANAFASGHFRVKIERRSLPEFPAQVEGGRYGIGPFALGGETILPAVGCAERRMSLDDAGELEVIAPAGIF